MVAMVTILHLVLETFSFLSSYFTGAINTLNCQNMKIVKFGKRADPDEAAHNEPPHLEQHDLHCSLGILHIRKIRDFFFFFVFFVFRNFADCCLAVCCIFLFLWGAF